MAYSSEVKEFARQLFNDGYSFVAIAKRVNKAFKKLYQKPTAKTIQKWSTNKRYRWRELKDAMQLRREKDEVRAAGATLAGRLADLDELIDKQIDDVKNTERGNLRTQVVYGLNALIQTRNDLEPSKRENTAVDEVAGALLNVLETIPKLKPLLRKHRKAILAAVKKATSKKVGGRR